MNKLIVVSNRLPVSVERRKGTFLCKGSVGGVATGLGSYTAHAGRECVWVGWPGLSASQIDAGKREQIRETLLREHGCVPVYLTDHDVRNFYSGFSNRTLWPLFHYFNESVEYDPRTWSAYERVNRKFADVVMDVADEGDTIWVQDYQLLLLPALLREKLPNAAIGFFLHIPFPSFEVFRQLPWRREIVEGLLGADIIGFHTYDYVRHFLEAARNLLGLEEQWGRLRVNSRRVLAEAFPMGIDFGRFVEGTRVSRVVAEVRRLHESTQHRKVVLSVDRLDYTKGIPERLKAFDEFFTAYPEWRGKVSLMCVAVPSRSQVQEYRQLKEEVDQLIGQVNGRWSTVDWTPIHYLYRSLSFHQLVGMYVAADVALVTPLRDGMNLIAKEYCASRTAEDGVLVLSEMAGAAKELGEALLVNPNDPGAMVEALRCALEMPAGEQAERMHAMRRRVRRYDIGRWAEDFMTSFENIRAEQARAASSTLDRQATEALVRAYKNARKRVLLLDYDGTLMPFATRPQAVEPDEALLGILRDLADDERTSVVVASGRDRGSLERWLGDLPVSLVAEHGVWIRPRGGEWATIEPMSDAWKERVRTVLEIFVDRTPGSFVEEKEFSLVWHHRASQSELIETRRVELKEALAGMLGDLGLAAVDGNKVVEVKRAEIHKGRAAHFWMSAEGVDFVLVVGDDRTDEDMFAVAPESAWTIKVGPGITEARYSLDSVVEVRGLLRELTEIEE